MRCFHLMEFLANMALQLLNVYKPQGKAQVTIGVEVFGRERRGGIYLRLIVGLC
jgi:hypothetical protein